MKTLLKSGLVLALGLLLHTSSAQAQVQVNVNIPVWGPAVGPNVQYYYLPEIDGYYDLYSQSYLFYDPAYGAWVSSPVLPRMYAGYDPRFFHPVVIQYIGRQPWGYLRDHRVYCNNWGVQPGRYYGANWPGRGYYAVPPRGGYNNGGGYYGGGRPGYPPGGYAQNGYRDDRNGGYRNDGRDNRGGYDRNERNDRGGQNSPGGFNQGGQRSPGGFNGGGNNQGGGSNGGGRGRGRVN